jgi:hypothetical protein
MSQQACDSIVTGLDPRSDRDADRRGDDRERRFFGARKRADDCDLSCYGLSLDQTLLHLEQVLDDFD